MRTRWPACIPLLAERTARMLRLWTHMRSRPYPSAAQGLSLTVPFPYECDVGLFALITAMVFVVTMLAVAGLTGGRG